MRIKIKVIYDDKYKDYDAFDAAIERWQEKGWILADTAQDFKNHGDAAAAIFWRPIPDSVPDSMKMRLE